MTEHMSDEQTARTFAKGWAPSPDTQNADELQEAYVAGWLARSLRDPSPAAAWNTGFIAGVNAADAARNGVYALFDRYTQCPYERPTDD